MVAISNPDYLTSTIESAFTFDDEGRLNGQTGVNARIPHWDAKGRLNALTAGGRTDVYLYDPTDHRVRRNGPTDYYLEGEHLESVDTFGKTREKYFRGASIDELVAGYLPDSTSNLIPVLFQHDGTMSVVAISNPNGTTIQTSQYSAFGSTINSTGSSISRLKYTGREDDGTGLYYYRARYYDPTIGRFISEDPLQFQAGINFYAYVNNNPVNANDPTGLAGQYQGIVDPMAIYSGFKSGWNWVAGKVERTNDIVKNVSEDAVNLAMKITGGNTLAASQLLHNGSVDAWRHAEASRQMTADPQLGSTFAALAGYQHEIKNTYDNAKWQLTSDPKAQPWGSFFNEVNMDLSNNRFGRIAGNTGISVISPSDPGLVYGAGGLQGQPNLSFSDYLGSSSAGNYLNGAAAGGFLLYPNKSNNNQMQSVYSK